MSSKNQMERLKGYLDNLYTDLQQAHELSNICCVLDFYVLYQRAWNHSAEFDSACAKYIFKACPDIVKFFIFPISYKEFLDIRNKDFKTLTSIETKAVEQFVASKEYKNFLSALNAFKKSQNMDTLEIIKDRYRIIYRNPRSREILTFALFLKYGHDVVVKPFDVVNSLLSSNLFLSKSDFLSLFNTPRIPYNREYFNICYRAIRDRKKSISDTIDASCYASLLSLYNNATNKPNIFFITSLIPYNKFRALSTPSATKLVRDCTYCALFIYFLNKYPKNDYLNQLNSIQQQIQIALNDKDHVRRQTAKRNIRAFLHDFHVSITDSVRADIMPLEALCSFIDSGYIISPTHFFQHVLSLIYDTFDTLLEIHDESELQKQCEIIKTKLDSLEAIFTQIISQKGVKKDVDKSTRLYMALQKAGDRYLDSMKPELIHLIENALQKSLIGQSPTLTLKEMLDNFKSTNNKHDIITTVKVSQKDLLDSVKNKSPQIQTTIIKTALLFTEFLREVDKIQ